MTYETSSPTFGAELYDPNKSMVIKKGYYYSSSSTAEFAEVKADDVSRTYWRLDALQETNNRFSRANDKVQEYLTENYDELNEHADEIARLLGIDLSKEVEVVFDVTIKATVSVPVDKDVSDLSVYDFDIEISSNESDYEVQEFEADINSIDEH